MTIGEAERLEKHVWWVGRILYAQAQRWVFDGQMTDKAQRWIARCRAQSDLTRTVVVFTRDAGHHSSGWLKNPDYERCFHLSMSAYPDDVKPEHEHLTTLADPRCVQLWLKAFFGESAKLAWRESAVSEQGKRLHVQHWRVFCDPHWTPIHPRGEVYGTEFTEKGWKSFSEVNS